MEYLDLVSQDRDDISRSRSETPIPEQGKKWKRGAINLRSWKGF